MHFKKYSTIPGEELMTIDDQRPCRASEKRQSDFRSFFLILSFTLNAVVLYFQFHPDRNHGSGMGSGAIGLRWNTTTRYLHDSPYSSTDRTVQDAAWATELPYRLAVALDDAYAESSLHALHSMRWPWDDDKGVYILQSGHQLHCLHSLRETVNDVQDQVTPRWSYAHQLHCIEMLLQSIKCYADDSLLYVGYLNDNLNRAVSDAIAGEGATRVCRDWNQLQTWADHHSACYNSSHGRDDPSVSETEKYRFCPDGREPWKAAES